jgi:hypothetical protein
VVASGGDYRDLGPHHAAMADALERRQGLLATSPHGFRFSVKPFPIVTVRLEGAENSRQWAGGC